MYASTLASVKTHALPEWYDHAKFGIFIHWTLSSVPAFAAAGTFDIGQMLSGKTDFTDSPYAEWYLNSLRIPGSQVHQHHLETYGPDFPYPQFAKIYNEQSRKWDPEAWTGLFERAGACYVVLVTKHHDGFLYWPSRHPNPRMPDYHTDRDMVGELSHSLSRHGMKMGCYYSSALDWTFTSRPIRTMGDLFTNGPSSREYRDYVEEHWIELIDRYDPWILWSDIGYPPHYNLASLFAYFYNRKPEGVVNDRWLQVPGFLFNPAGESLIDWMAKRSLQAGKTTTPNAFPLRFRDHRIHRFPEAGSLQVGSLPRDRQLVWIQPVRDSRGLPEAGPTDPHAGRYRQQERQPAAERRPAPGWKHSRLPGRSAGRHRPVAVGQRRSHLCHPAVEALPGCRRERRRSPLYAEGKSAST